MPHIGPHRLAVKFNRHMPELDEHGQAFSPREGDILVVGDATPIYGDHITLVKSYDATNGVFETVSGNGGGDGPDGKYREGVVVRGYALNGPGYRALWLYRPAPSDLMPPLAPLAVH